MDLGLRGKRALVIGATGNTGMAIARRLDLEGCEVIAVARNAERLRDLGAIRQIEADISDQVHLEAMIAAVWAIGAPDVIVHVAGHSMGIKDPGSNWQDVAKVVQLNLGAAIDINRAFLPAMLQRGFGRIVHFSSNGVKLAIGNMPYTTAKAALEGYVRTQAKVYAARGVVITAVSPGPIKTEGRFLYSQPEEWTDHFFEQYVPMKRWGAGEEIAPVVAFLCSQHASYMAGAIVDVDGGMR